MSLWNDRNFAPMLLHEENKPFNSKDYLYEIKFDGIRAIIFASPKEVKIYSRNKNDITYLYPELQSIKNIVKRNTIFDGEIISMENKVPSFSKLQERARLKSKSKILSHMKTKPVIFICFDILYDGKNIMDLPLIKRKKILNKYKENDYFMISKYIINNGINLFKSIKKLNLEGIVAKKIDSMYEINTRSSSWIKIKNIHREAFFVGGYIKNKSNYTITLVLGEKKNNKLYYVGKVILGKKHKLYEDIIKMKTIRKTPFVDYDEENTTYLNPDITCVVKYTEKTKNGNLRHAVIGN